MGHLTLSCVIKYVILLKKRFEQIFHRFSAYLFSSGGKVPGTKQLNLSTYHILDRQGCVGYVFGEIAFIMPIWALFQG